LTFDDRHLADARLQVLGALRLLVVGELSVSLDQLLLQIARVVEVDRRRRGRGRVGRRRRRHRLFGELRLGLLHLAALDAQEVQDAVDRGHARQRVLAQRLDEVRAAQQPDLVLRQDLDHARVRQRRQERAGLVARGGVECDLL
jgi:hypothetical protein